MTRRDGVGAIVKIRPLILRVSKVLLSGGGNDGTATANGGTGSGKRGDWSAAAVPRRIPRRPGAKHRVARRTLPSTRGVWYSARDHPPLVSGCLMVHRLALRDWPREG